MAVDFEAAFDSYLARFRAKFGAKADGAFVKFGKHMVQKLSKQDFKPRLDRYLQVQGMCKKMLDGGSTISDAIVLEFEEAAAWLTLEAPDLLKMFRGELGDPTSMPEIDVDMDVEP